MQHNRNHFSQLFYRIEVGTRGDLGGWGEGLEVNRGVEGTTGVEGAELAHLRGGG